MVEKKVRLSKRVVDSLGAQEKEYVVWDKEISGFGLRITKTGRKSFILKYRNYLGKSKQLTIGTYGALTVDHARKAALDYWADIAKGKDPVEAKKAAKKYETIAELCDRYFTEASAGRVLSRGKVKKQSTLATDRGRIDRHIKPLLGAQPIEKITRQDIIKFMNDIITGKTAGVFSTGKRGSVARVTGGRGSAAKAVSLLSAIYNWGIYEGSIQVENPCIGVEKPKDQKRDRILTKSEYATLKQYFSNSEKQQELSLINPYALNCIKLIMLTGFRRNEALELTWQEIDFAEQVVRFQDTKTGAQVRPLGKIVIDFLNALPRDHEKWVFPAYRGEGHLVNIRKPLIQLLEKAGIDTDITPHIFRHNFASVANELGFSELTIGALIGHQNHSITGRYVHHVDEVLINAANKISHEIYNRCLGDLNGEVISLSNYRKIQEI